jgi:acetyl esterase/lipase
MKLELTLIALLFAPLTTLIAADAPPKEQKPAPEFRKYELPVEPDENVAYGPHRMQVIYFWRAKSDQPTPLLVYIHGGGWQGGDRSVVRSMLLPALEAGISVVSVEYRFVTEAMLAKVSPPLQWPMDDAARALQFVRSRATEWNIDKTRIAASGSSAGGCTSLWLVFHDDLADPASADPVARESTRLLCAAVDRAQTTLDPQQMKEWTPNSDYGGHAFGFMPDPHDLKTRDTQFPQFLAARDSLLPWIQRYSPIAHVTKDDPPVYLLYTTPPAMGKDDAEARHSANFGVPLQEKLRGLGVECELVYPGAPNVKHATMTAYLIERLKAN